MKKLVVVAMAAAALSAAAMFTEAEFAKASKDVQAALKTQIASWQRGEIADGAVTVADVALKAAWFRADITPPVGTALGGYGPNDVSVAVHDPLYACGLALCNGGEKVMLVALDVLGMDACVIRDMRVRLARGFGTKPANVMLTCTHNHEGPHTRQINEGNPRMKLSYGLDDASVKVDSAYLRRVSDVLAAAVDELSDTGRWREVLLGYYSAQVDENCNRRFTTVDNRASFIAHRRTLKAVVGCNVYYTRAYASWEKGSVENCNRFVRRWYPKGTDFGKCTAADMHRLERVINSIHRKLLNGLTAYQYDTAYAKAA